MFAPVQKVSLVSCRGESQKTSPDRTALKRQNTFTISEDEDDDDEEDELRIKRTHFEDFNKDNLKMDAASAAAAESSSPARRGKLNSRSTPTKIKRRSGLPQRTAANPDMSAASSSVASSSPQLSARVQKSTPQKTAVGAASTVTPSNRKSYCAPPSDVKSALRAYKVAKREGRVFSHNTPITPMNPRQRHYEKLVEKRRDSMEETDESLGILSPSEMPGLPSLSASINSNFAWEKLSVEDGVAGGQEDEDDSLKQDEDITVSEDPSSNSSQLSQKRVLASSTPGRGPSATSLIPTMSPIKTFSLDTEKLKEIEALTEEDDVLQVIQQTGYKKKVSNVPVVSLLPKRKYSDFEDTDLLLARTEQLLNTSRERRNRIRRQEEMTKSATKQVPKPCPPVKKSSVKKQEPRPDFNLDTTIDYPETPEKIMIVEDIENKFAPEKPTAGEDNHHHHLPASIEAGDNNVEIKNQDAVSDIKDCEPTFDAESLSTCNKLRQDLEEKLLAENAKDCPQKFTDSEGAGHSTNDMPNPLFQDPAQIYGHVTASKADTNDHHPHHVGSNNSVGGGIVNKSIGKVLESNFSANVMTSSSTSSKAETVSSGIGSMPSSMISMATSQDLHSDLESSGIFSSSSGGEHHGEAKGATKQLPNISPIVETEDDLKKEIAALDTADEESQPLEIVEDEASVECEVEDGSEKLAGKRKKSTAQEEGEEVANKPESKRRNRSRSSEKGMATRRSELLQKERIMPNTNVPSKLKAILASEENNKNLKKPLKQKKAGKWDEIMNKIAEGQKTAPVIAKDKSEVRSRVYDGFKHPVIRGNSGSRPASAKSSEMGSMKNIHKRLVPPRFQIFLKHFLMRILTYPNVSFSSSGNKHSDLEVPTTSTNSVISRSSSAVSIVSSVLSGSVSNSGSKIPILSRANSVLSEVSLNSERSRRLPKKKTSVPSSGKVNPKDSRKHGSQTTNFLRKNLTRPSENGGEIAAASKINKATRKSEIGKHRILLLHLIYSMKRAKYSFSKNK